MRPSMAAAPRRSGSRRLSLCLIIIITIITINIIIIIIIIIIILLSYSINYVYFAKFIAKDKRINIYIRHKHYRHMNALISISNVIITINITHFTI